MSQIHTSVYGHFTIVAMSCWLQLWWNAHKHLCGFGTWSKSIVFMVKTFAVHAWRWCHLEITYEEKCGYITNWTSKEVHSSVAFSFLLPVYVSDDSRGKLATKAISMFLIFMVVLTIRPINHPYDLWKKKNTLKVHCKYKQW